MKTYLLEHRSHARDERQRERESDMWKKCSIPDKDCVFEDGKTFNPVATIEDGHRRVQVVEDANSPEWLLLCFLTSCENKDRQYRKGVWPCHYSQSQDEADLKKVLAVLILEHQSRRRSN